ncbi:MAG: hypothetical protein SP4CHLAM5_03090 [Chlamydiia bacterium]|nr:hypothetical protein [Chlamydiia bacterium]
MKKTLLTSMLLAGTMFASNTASAIDYDQEEPNKHHFTLSLQGEKPYSGMFDAKSPVYVGAGFGFQTAIDEDAFIESYSFEADTTMYFESQIIPAPTKTPDPAPAPDKVTSTETTDKATLAETTDETTDKATQAAEPTKKEIPATKYALTSISQTFKASGIKYFDSTDENRLFVCGGPFATVRIGRAFKDVNTSVATYSFSGIDLGASLGVGIELGEPSEIINTLKLVYFQPLMNISKGIKEGVPTDNTPAIGTKQTESILCNSTFKNLGTVALTYSIGF